MPKVGKFTLRFENGKPREFEIWYNQKKKFYAKDFPADMISQVRSADPAFNKRAQEFDTENQLISYYTKIVDRWFELNKAQRSVILLKVSISDGIAENKERDDRFGGYLVNEKPWFEPFKDIVKVEGMDYAVGFEYVTGIIITNKTETFFECEFDQEGNEVPDTRSSWGRDLKENSWFVSTEKQIVLDYSPAAAEFLTELKGRFEMMAQKLIQFLADKTKLVKAIEDRQKLLLPAVTD